MEIYLEQKGLALEAELMRCVDTLFSKYVPQGVRQYLDLKSGGGENVTEEITDKR